MKNINFSEADFTGMIPEDVKTVVILGHVRPDGDCVGSTMGMKTYLKTVRPELEVKIILEPFDETFKMLPACREIIPMQEADLKEEFDLCLSCDASDPERLGDGKALFDKAKHTLCIDHHITNQGFADVNYVRGGLSSCSEALCELFDADKISKECAEFLYLGIVHDTGVFRFDSVTEETMKKAGMLVSKGIDQTAIIDKTFFAQTFVQKKILGIALSRIRSHLQGRVVSTLITAEDMELAGADKRDLSGIVAELRTITGVEAAIFAYETSDQEYKYSLRSNYIVDVAAICARRGGGGHVRAAGFSSKENPELVMAELLAEMEADLK